MTLRASTSPTVGSDLHKFVHPESTKKILLIRNGLLGDAVFITPLLRRLHAHLPHAIIDLVTSASSVELFQNSYVRIAYGLAPKFSLWKHLRFFFSLRRQRYDLVFVQEMNTHYTLMAKLAGGKHLVGYTTSVAYLLDTAFERREDVHAVDAELATVRGWTEAPEGIDTTELFVSADERNALDSQLKSYGITSSDVVACLHVGTSGENSERLWAPERYAELADTLISKRKVKILFTGIEKDRTTVERIRSMMRSDSIDLVGKTPLRQLMALLQRANVIVGPDTGTLHIANAVGTPAVMLMGYADKNHTGAYGTDSINISVDLPCIGCVRRDPKPEQWDICKTLRPVKCMQLITTDKVFDAVSTVLNRKKYKHTQ
ncbi:MAG: glycosyltransferase family 9 protein [Ignavibacteriales bacterium]|nr:glycosyltransferase family 9 protein [Ignavibacteriales bacterium]